MKVPLPSNIRVAKKVASHPATRSFASEVQRNMPAGTASETAKAQAEASSKGPTFDSIGIKNRQINEKSGVSLDEHQKVLVGSVLDVSIRLQYSSELIRSNATQLFNGNPTLKHFSLWAKDATFQDSITTATGFDKYAAQWYGLPALFNPIRIKSHTVISSGNPIELELSNSYTLKGLGTEQTMDSVVSIETGPEGKIIKVQDRWNNKLPEGVLAQGLRKLNSASVPLFVKVPKTEEEDAQLKADREKNAK